MTVITGPLEKKITPDLTLELTTNLTTNYVKGKAEVKPSTCIAPCMVYKPL